MEIKENKLELNDEENKIILAEIDKWNLIRHTWWLTDKTKLRKLNLGCGYRHKISGNWINIDSDEQCYPDIIHDIRCGLPFDDNTVEEIYASHVLEHLTPDELTRLMKEIWRVCVNKAKIYIISPLYTNTKLVWDIEHRCVITDRTFWLFRRNFTGVQSFNKINENKYYFNELECFEDYKGEKHAEAQIYLTLEADKNTIPEINNKIFLGEEDAKDLLGKPKG